MCVSVYRIFDNWSYVYSPYPIAIYVSPTMDMNEKEEKKSLEVNAVLPVSETKKEIYFIFFR